MAADQGDAQGQYNLGDFYYSGIGVAQDYAEARRLLLSAAEQHHAHAFHSLGTMSVQGAGVPVDYVEAHKWLILAFEYANNGTDEDWYQETQDNFEHHLSHADKREAERRAADWLAAHP